MSPRPTESRGMTRRYGLFVGGVRLAGLVVLAGLLLPGCSNRDRVNQIEGQEPWRNIELPPLPDFELAPKLRLLIWRDYFDPEVLQRFETHYGVELEITFFENNSDLEQRYRADPEAFDLLMPSSYMVERFINADLLAKIDKQMIPNLGNVAPIFFQAEYDRELQYSVPFFYSYLGVAFNSNYLRSLPRDFELTSESREENLILYGYRSLLDENRITIASQLLQNGFDHNSTNPEHVELIIDQLIANSAERGIRFLADDLPTALIKNEILIAACWSGAAGYALEENPAIRFVLPTGPKFLEIDSLVILKASPYQATAKFLINYLLIPAMAGANTNYSFYANSSETSRPFVSRDILIGPSYMNAPAGTSILLKDLGDFEDFYEQEWDRMKSLLQPVPPKIPLRTSPRATVQEDDFGRQNQSMP